MWDLLAFIHVAKTGGQTIETMLANSFGASYSTAPEWARSSDLEDADAPFVVPKFQPDDLRRLLRICPWTRCVGGHAVTLWSGFGEVVPTKWFSMVREPMVRGASHYQYNLKHENTPRLWEDWVQWPVHHNHQAKMFSRLGVADDAINNILKHDVFVGLTERFDESLVMLEKLVTPGLNISYRRTNTATDNSLAKKVMNDQGKVDQLKAMYKEDLVLHEFIAKELFPKYCREYGPTLSSDVEKFRQMRERGFNRWKFWQSRLNHHLILRPSHLLK